MRDATIEEQKYVSSNIESISSRTGVNCFGKSTLVEKIENLIDEIDQNMHDDLYLISVDMSNGRVYEYLRDIKWKLENILSSEQIMMKYHFRRKGEKRLFKVCDKYYNNRVFTVYKVNKKGTMFLIYNYDVSEWQWVYSDSYIPIED